MYKVTGKFVTTMLIDHKALVLAWKVKGMSSDNINEALSTYSAVQGAYKMMTFWREMPTLKAQDS
jgi:hypothetical protein